MQRHVQGEILDCVKQALETIFFLLTNLFDTVKQFWNFKEMNRESGVRKETLHDKAYVNVGQRCEHVIEMCINYLDIDHFAPNEKQTINYLLLLCSLVYHFI